MCSLVLVVILDWPVKLLHHTYPRPGPSNCRPAFAGSLPRSARPRTPRLPGITELMENLCAEVGQQSVRLMFPIFVL